MPKTNALSNIDMDKILKSQGINIHGIYMKDELPVKLKRGFYIVNLQSSNVGNGTHWTAFYYSPKHSYYFDAFGFVAPEEVENKFKVYTYNDKQIQDLKSTACGYYCIAFILFMNGQKNKNKGFETFVDLFSDDTKKNDKKLYQLLYD